MPLRVSLQKGCLKGQIFASENFLFKKMKNTTFCEHVLSIPAKHARFLGRATFAPSHLKKSASVTMTPLADRRSLRLCRIRTQHIPMPCSCRYSPENIHLPSDTPLLPAPPQPPPCRSTYGCCGWVPASASASFRLLPPPSASASVHPVRSASVRLPKPRQTWAASRERVPLLRHASSEVSVFQFHPFFRKTLFLWGTPPY